MSASLLALCVVLNAAGHARVVESEDLESAEASAIVRAFDASIERRIGAQEAAAQEVTVRLFGGLTLIRLIAERADAPGGAARVEVDLPRERDLWLEPLELAARALFPELPKTDAITATATATTAAPAAKERSLTPWIVLGASAAALAVGTGFGLSTRSARSQSEALPPGAEFDRLADRTQAHAIVADLFFLAALIGGGTAAVLYGLEE